MSSASEFVGCVVCSGVTIQSAKYLFIPTKKTEHINLGISRIKIVKWNNVVKMFNSYTAKKLLQRSTSQT